MRIFCDWFDKRRFDAGQFFSCDVLTRISQNMLFLQILPNVKTIVDQDTTTIRKL